MNMWPRLLPSLILIIAVAACSESDSRGAKPGPGIGASKVDPNDSAFRERMRARLDEMKQEASVIEEAPWLGKTGLSEEIEREVPRYLRREFGVLLSQPGSLKAADLVYLGVFVEGSEIVHYWQIDGGPPEPKFAYVVSAPRPLMGWGDRRLPRKALK